MCPEFIVNEKQMVGSTLHLTVTQTSWKSTGCSQVGTENARVHAIQHGDLISLRKESNHNSFVNRKI